MRAVPRGIIVSALRVGAWCLASAIGGFLFGMLQRDATNMSPGQVPGFEYLITAHSFSDVSNARAVLQALATRSLVELRQKRISAGLLAGADHSGLDPGVRENRVGAGITGLRKAMGEFEGTEQERLLAQDLLILLKNEHRNRDYLEVYFHVLYMHPGSPVIGARAGEALTMARPVQSERKLAAAFRHVLEVPFTLPCKARLQELLETELKQFSCEPPLAGGAT